jgi:tetratricopeptide (TPR) repeat protein
LSWTTPSRARDAREDGTNVRLSALLQEGSQMMSANNPAGAAAAYREAEKIAPRSPAIHKARVEAERRASELGQVVGMQQEKLNRINEARQAMDARRWDDAVAALEAALALDPADALVQQMLTAARTSQARARTAPVTPRIPRKGQQETVATLPVSEPTPTRTESRPAEPVSQVATIHITFDSEVAGASARVYLGSDTIFDKRLGERGVFSRRNKGGQSHAEQDARLAAGEAKFRVYVTPPGQKGILNPISGNFIGGQTRHLEIRFNDGSPPVVALH